MTPAGLVLATAGWTLVWSWLGHVLDYRGFTETLRNHAVVGPVDLVAPAFVVVEGVLGTAAVALPLLAPGATGLHVGVALTSSALFGAFAVYLAALRRRDPRARCGCGRHGAVSTGAIARAAVLAAAAGGAAVAMAVGSGGNGERGLLVALTTAAASGAAGYLVLHGAGVPPVEVRS